MANFSHSKLKESISYFTKHHPNHGIHLDYGTAGFRDKATYLNHVALRMGMLMALRAFDTKKSVGLMITASHNHVVDNGIKAVDPDGGMLDQIWEIYATKFVNCIDNKVYEAFCEIATLNGVDLCNEELYNGKFVVFIGRDTRPDSVRLARLVEHGISTICHCRVMDVGLVTTPQLHHCVQSFNQLADLNLASEQGYYKKLSEAYLALLNGRKPSSPFIVDAAFGIGGTKFAEVLRVVNSHTPNALWCHQIRNSPTHTGSPLMFDEEAMRLNDGVGAEHVQKTLQFPRYDTIDISNEAGQRFASFDGDADRVIYFRARKSDGSLNLFDGDKIACLFAFFIRKQLAKLPVAFSKSVKFGCVQTAYANGAAQEYIHNVLKIETAMTKTGVKFLHHKALEYDIAVYFEANGHGTVLFSPSFIEKLCQVLDTTILAEEEISAARNLLALEQLFNQATGDAMADCLAVEAILCLEGLTLDLWDEFYMNLPSRQLKCSVANKNLIKTSEDETRVLEPRAFQDIVDNVVKDCEKGRAFVRPSGTENVVRIYAEASTIKLADALARKISLAVCDLCHGVSDSPS